MQISAPFMGKKCRPKTPIGIPYYSSSNQNEWISAPSNMQISAPFMGKKCRPKTPIGIPYYSSSNQNVEISAPFEIGHFLYLKWARNLQEKPK
jgi:hypothetical protein